MDEYEVQINGLPHTLLLDKESAKRYPDAKLKQPETKQADAPKNKARIPENKEK